ncbi:hypothetical protein B0H11DRAFT_37584 [Mycena galericulata]|nr:hypothetical protein B0H11DRAFT_37584 [Mycena galericulata]
MCFCFLWCFGHRCRQYTDELNILWPHFERHYTVAGFIQQFLYRLKQAQIIAAPSLGSGSVSYCRARGPSAYPFLLIELRVVDAGLYHQPVMLKFQGFDGPPPMREPDYVWYPFDTPQEDTTLSLAYIGESARQFVGTRRYDVCHRWAVGVMW